MSLGVVVVGLGRAGNARVRDIGQAAKYVASFPCLEGVHLVGHVSRRGIAAEGSQVLEMEEVLKRPDVNIVIICTENATHDKIARECLEAGKHVLVEFPISLTNESYSQLSQLAKDKGVKYREEDIALFTDDLQRLKDFAKDKTLKEGEVTQLDLKAVDARIDRRENKITTFGQLKDAAGKSLKINIGLEKRDPFRKKTYTYWFTDGSIIQEVPPAGPPSAPSPDKPGLFMRDFIGFVDNIKNDVDYAPSLWITERAIQLANDLHDLAKQSSQSFGLV